jgi:hypothetical protein
MTTREFTNAFAIFFALITTGMCAIFALSFWTWRAPLAITITAWAGAALMPTFTENWKDN